MRFFFTFFLSTISLGSCAWEILVSNLQSEAMTLAQANAELNATLMAVPVEDSDPSKNLEKIACYLESNQDFFSPLSGVIDVLKTINNRYENASTRDLKRALIQQINASLARDAGSGFLLFKSALLNNIDKPKVEISLYSDLLEAYCTSNADLRCTKASNLAKNLWWIVGEYRGISNLVNTPDKLDSLAYTNKIDQQWRSYKDDTITLWPQEVLLNSLIYSPARKGLSSPPNYKLLALRPTLGLSYLSEESHRIQPTINVDLIGVYWWQYGHKNDSFKAQTGRGISLSTVLDGNDTAFGFTYHHNPKWSFTLARGDENDLVASISFQFAHWLFKR